MKLNNKGFVVSTLMYALLIVFLFLIIGIITLLANRKMILDKLKKDVKEDINGMTKYTYYPDGTAIYYNPVTDKLCSDYEEENSLNETKTGCMKWYTFNDNINSNKVSMILDHNTTYKVAWANHDDYIEAGGTEANWTAEKYSEQGPVTINKKLKEDTKDWQVSARLIEADEIAHIVGADKDDTIKWSQNKPYGTDNINNKSGWFYFDGSGNTYSDSNGWQKQVANSSNKSKYSWLYDYSNCEDYGCNYNDNSNEGYWTINSVYNDSFYVWRVNRTGALSRHYAIGNNLYGIRPVITVDKKDIYVQYKDEILNGADPELQKDMIPVTIDNDGVVKKADTTKEWYNYKDKKWANAIVLTDNSTYEPGAIIPENKIKAYYVWIPRYKYQLFNSTTPITIQITFESNNKTKSSSTTVGEYLTHPAFTYGADELNGFWVGKFETTSSAEAPTIKPNTASLRNQNVSTQYATSLLVSDSSRMMKNDEWGAVAYLSHSKYGVNKQVRINNNNGFKTGCGADTENKASSSTCDIQYGDATSYPQSTTGNITGIFDTSGGASEYMMSVRADSSGKPLSGRHNIYNSGFNGKFGCPTCDSTTSGVDSSILELTTGTNFPDSKDYIIYDNPSNRDSITGNNGCNGSKCYGHALTETKNWNGDYYYFPPVWYPWVLRGGNYSNGTYAGVFSAGNDDGHAGSISSFRVVVPAS